MNCCVYDYFCNISLIDGAISLLSRLKIAKISFIKKIFVFLSFSVMKGRCYNPIINKKA